MREKENKRNREMKRIFNDQLEEKVFFFLEKLLMQIAHFKTKTGPQTTKVTSRHLGHIDTLTLGTTIKRPY